MQCKVLLTYQSDNAWMRSVMSIYHKFEDFHIQFEELDMEYIIRKSIFFWSWKQLELVRLEIYS